MLVCATRTAEISNGGNRTVIKQNIYSKTITRCRMCPWSRSTATNRSSVPAEDIGLTYPRRACLLQRHIVPTFAESLRNFRDLRFTVLHASALRFVSVFYHSFY